MCEQNAAYLAKHSELGSKNLNKIWLKIIQKSFTASKFSKNFRESMPSDPLELFLFVNQLQISFAEKKYAWKECGNYGPPFNNFSLRHWQ